MCGTIQQKKGEVPVSIRWLLSVVLAAARLLLAAR